MYKQTRQFGFPYPEGPPLTRDIDGFVESVVQRECYQKGLTGSHELFTQIVRNSIDYRQLGRMAATLYVEMFNDAIHRNTGINLQLETIDLTPWYYEGKGRTVVVFILTVSAPVLALTKIFLDMTAAEFVRIVRRSRNHHHEATDFWHFLERPVAEWTDKELGLLLQAFAQYALPTDYHEQIVKRIHEDGRVDAALHTYLDRETLETLVLANLDTQELPN